jgi:hypothetical protein
MIFPADAVGAVRKRIDPQTERRPAAVFGIGARQASSIIHRNFQL